ncbi:hypothetical protein BaRGS_00033230 [Batillaria attramentaria]|uniref:Uncharacterized protein n=1 Tax=Batillaria attramentaria TaxID=370345 RepID=A0ABD0JL12_9CAEN
MTAHHLKPSGCCSLQVASPLDGPISQPLFLGNMTRRHLHMASQGLHNFTPLKWTLSSTTAHPNEQKRLSATPDLRAVEFWCSELGRSKRIDEWAMKQLPEFSPSSCYRGRSSPLVDLNHYCAPIRK